MENYTEFYRQKAHMLHEGNLAKARETNKKGKAKADRLDNRDVQ